ncbi:glutathione ABC transporter permease [Frondihabitans sucicola]|uniref:Glutathione ABC transporter permease n=1 Tax=Frondihabitans sucicola TaxID=1268041 RepID=A0ABN6XTH7_9MICO|nr:ABC transporter permease [Frondihabitans sucicola]BDZ48314.1 glutathione ABC transporter permease [Frondihabitans sucicola]
MTRYLSRRLVQALATIFAVVTVAFAFGRLSGSPAALLLTENAPKSQIVALNHRLGFDKPLWLQYVDYLGGLLHGDFGQSYRQVGVSSMSLVLERLPASLLLGAVGLTAGILLAMVAGLVIQLTGSRGLRTTALGIGAVRQAIPDFFFGLLLVLIFSVTLGILPSLGNRGITSVIMPALTIATGQFILYMRLIDNSLTEQSSMDYARTAYARGDSRFRVVLGELLPNAFLPVMTVAGISLGGFLGGLVIVENVFAWPGMGQLMLSAVYSRDFPVVQSGLIVVAGLFIVANFAVDLCYALIDPRVRLR